MLVPAVVFYHVGHFDNELSFFVFLAVFEGMLIFPTESCFTALAINIGDCMKACQQNPFLSWPATNIHYFIEQIRSSLATLERLWNKFVVVGQMSSAMDAAILSVALRTQIGLKRFHHVTQDRKFTTEMKCTGALKLTDLRGRESVAHYSR